MADRSRSSRRVEAKAARTAGEEEAVAAAVATAAIVETRQPRHHCYVARLTSSLYYLLILVRFLSNLPTITYVLLPCPRSINSHCRSPYFSLHGQYSLRQYTIPNTTDLEGFWDALLGRYVQAGLAISSLESHCTDPCKVNF